MLSSFKEYKFEPSCCSNINSLDIPRNLQKGLFILTELNQLGYVDYNGNEYSLTDNGIEHFFKNHMTFLDDIKGKNIDFGPFQGMINDILEKSKKYGVERNSNRKEFFLQNTSIFYE
jgi:hypothetical protein